MSDMISVFGFFRVFICHTLLENLSSCTSNVHDEGRWKGCCELVADKCQCMFSENVSDEQ